MLPLKEKDRPIIQKLLDAGCCGRCILRFCCIGTQSAYRLSNEDLWKDLHAFVSNTEVASQTPSDDPPSKRIKLDSDGKADGGETEGVPMVTAEPTADGTESSVCVVCLGVLQDFCNPSFTKKISEVVKSEEYQFESLVLSVSLPAQLLVREHSCWLHIKKEVREKSMCLDKEDVIQVKEAFKWTVQSMLSETLGVPAVMKSPFEVAVGFIHPDTDADCHFLAEACSDCFHTSKNKERSVFTRMAVVKALEKITDKKFLNEYPSPPAGVKTACVAQETTCLHLSTYVAGRYNKFSRTLPQTPWVIDGERRMESSVEELIAAPLLTAFKCESFNFSSSGREDVDVRTLGNGRPFAMELLNPHRLKFNKMEVRQLQEEINQSSDKIRIRDLQLVTREAMGHMKEGEEDKTKSYSALIWSQKAITEEDIEFIGNIKDLEIAQKTPLRVLHRRPLAVRQRVIHTMSTSHLNPHHFTLQLRTQAGTYIKEFVHGDFGRTKPNLGELMKTEVDILELDVESVDVDWPPAIPE
ncbi:putative tRNA pseudouridine synthase Pus10 [Clupea harengus]|uniref:tRNA pseudouridine synthase Pus10 n=1 Tax=Clupea harengus TaxID=7950 RepID=A0A6P3VQ56_CLUHA|nr:putative tRNA pseudouridine synthase Pus10 [Clupea harengus]XP_012677962.2 putative tRNA pseudouridine synthase Pus10 [Clupea harengus]